MLPLTVIFMLTGYKNMHKLAADETLGSCCCCCLKCT